jgi:CheY-like chemotaxis protein
MKQRIPRRAWNSPAGAAHRPRILIEDDRPALAISDFSLFQQAGFDVAFCSGPGPDEAACPLLRGQECPALSGADAVLHGLDARLGVARSIRRALPGTPVVVRQHRLDDGSDQAVPDGCVPLAPECSVPGQISALKRALASRPPV